MFLDVRIKLFRWQCNQLLNIIQIMTHQFFALQNTKHKTPFDFYCPPKKKMKKRHAKQNLIKLLTPHDRHWRKRRRQYSRSSKPNIKSIRFWPDGVSMTLAFSIRAFILTAASLNKSTSCRLIRIFSMLEKNLRLRTNKPASAVKNLICWI